MLTPRRLPRSRRRVVPTLLAGAALITATAAPPAAPGADAVRAAPAPGRVWKPRCGQASDGWHCWISAHRSGGAGPPTGAAGGGAAPAEDACSWTGGRPGEAGRTGGGGDAGGGAGGDECLDTVSGPAGPSRVSTAEATEMAMDAIVLPPPRLRTNPAGRTWVGLRTFLWIERGGWRAHRASVSVTGQRIDMSARPAYVVWDLGETSLRCAGPGVPYRRGRSTNCGHAYRRGTAGLPGGAYRIKATLYYAVRWTCHGRCDTPGGTFNPLPATSTARLAVAEIQTRTTGA